MLSLTSDLWIHHILPLLTPPLEPIHEDSSFQENFKLALLYREALPLFLVNHEFNTYLTVLKGRISHFKLDWDNFQGQFEEKWKIIALKLFFFNIPMNNDERIKINGALLLELNQSKADVPMIKFLLYFNKRFKLGLLNIKNGFQETPLHIIVEFLNRDSSFEQLLEIFLEAEHDPKKALTNKSPLKDSMNNDNLVSPLDKLRLNYISPNGLNILSKYGCGEELLTKIFRFYDF